MSMAAWEAVRRDFASDEQSRGFTLSEIARLARGAATHPRIRRAAVAMARQCPPRDSRCYARAILAAVRARCAWVPDPESLDGGHELIADPVYTIDARGGDCDDLTALYVALALAIGLSVAVVSGLRASGRRHVFPAVKIDGQWLAADPSSRDPLGSDPGLQVETFQEVN